MAFYGVVPEGAGGHLITIEAQVNLAAPSRVDALDGKIQLGVGSYLLGRSEGFQANV